MSVDEKPFTIDVYEQRAVSAILAEVTRRGYDDVTLDPVVAQLMARLMVAELDRAERVGSR